MFDHCKMLLKLVNIICLTVATSVAGIEDEPVCSRFDYDQKMLQKIIALEWDLKQLISQFKQQSERLEDEILKRKTLERKLQQIEGVISLDGTGSVYVRWGRTSCPGNGTNLVYKGFAGGAHFDNKGGAANYLCLPEEPTWNVYEDTTQSSQTVWGAEYQLGDAGRNMNNFFGKPLLDRDVPCSVCHTKRATLVVIPGRNMCYDGWTLEYQGYLTAGHTEHYASEFVCTDGHPEALIGGIENQNGKLFYFTEARCGSLRCPPYVNGRELTCAVCSK